MTMIKDKKPMGMAARRFQMLSPKSDPLGAWGPPPENQMQKGQSRQIQNKAPSSSRASRRARLCDPAQHGGPQGEEVSPTRSPGQELSPQHHSCLPRHDASSTGALSLEGGGRVNCHYPAWKVVPSEWAGAPTGAVILCEAHARQLTPPRVHDDSVSESRFQVIPTPAPLSLTWRAF